MTFKQLVKMINEIKAAEDAYEVWDNIDRSFEKEKITWDDHEMLYGLASKMWKLYGGR